MILYFLKIIKEIFDQLSPFVQDIEATNSFREDVFTVILTMRDRYFHGDD